MVLIAELLAEKQNNTTSRLRVDPQPTGENCNKSAINCEP